MATATAETLTNDFFMKHTAIQIEINSFAWSAAKPFGVAIEFEFEKGDGDGGDDDNNMV